MASLCDFLRVRGVPEEAISLMEDQKFDNIIELMDDALLAD